MESHSRRLSLADQMEDNPQMDEHDNNMTAQKQGGWTPGPWLTQWEHDGDESIWSRDGGMHLLATCHAEDCDRSIPVKANARLISAAPCAMALVGRVAALNPDAGEIGAGMLVQLVTEARRIQACANPSTDKEQRSCAS